MILVCGGIKGGTGKTTLATNLVTLRATRKKVLLVDADEQQSATDWSEIRPANMLPTFTTITLTGKNIYAQLSRLKNDYDDIIIDVGGRDTTSQRSALMVADIFLVPFKPRSLDIWTISKVKQLIDEIHTANPNLKTYFIVNQADPRGSDNQDALLVLEGSGIFCPPNFIINRKCFCNAASQGMGITELEKPDSKAVTEILTLHDMIYK